MTCIVFLCILDFDHPTRPSRDQIVKKHLPQSHQDTKGFLMVGGFDLNAERKNPKELGRPYHLFLGILGGLVAFNKHQLEDKKDLPFLHRLY